MMDPQRLKARQGWEWIKQGYALFIKAPLLWIVLLFICMIAAVAISSVPIVGEPLVSLLTPAILVGLMVGCRALSQGEELELAHLFSGFKQHTSQLVTLGGISLVTQFLILGLMMVAGGATLVGILISGQPQTDPNVMMQALAGASFAVLLGIVLFSLLMMAMQFAPMLVYFRNVPPLQAMRLSLRAFLPQCRPDAGVRHDVPVFGGTCQPPDVSRLGGVVAARIHFAVCQLQRHFSASERDQQHTAAKRNF